MQVVSYREEYRTYFERLKRDWIEAHFAIENGDREVFDDPWGKIIAPGGQIFFVLVDNRVAGTCAALRHDAAVYELAKMAVAPEARGRGYGSLLINVAIGFARAAGAEALVLVSNTRLRNAIRLYEKHGFRRIPLGPEDQWERADIKMCLDLEPNR